MPAQLDKQTYCKLSGRWQDYHLRKQVHHLGCFSAMTSRKNQWTGSVCELLKGSDVKYAITQPRSYHWSRHTEAQMCQPAIGTYRIPSFPSHKSNPALLKSQKTLQAYSRRDLKIQDKYLTLALCHGCARLSSASTKNRRGLLPVLVMLLLLCCA